MLSPMCLTLKLYYTKFLYFVLAEFTWTSSSLDLPSCHVLNKTGFIFAIVNIVQSALTHTNYICIKMTKLIYTETDEAPMLATYSLLPVIQRFAKPMGIEV